MINTAAATVDARIPLGTLAANLLGCMLAGVLLAYVVQRDQPSPHLRLLLATGFLGGLTTFSAFGFETVQMFQRGLSMAALINIFANVTLSLGAVFAGYGAARMIA